MHTPTVRTPLAGAALRYSFAAGAVVAMTLLTASCGRKDFEPGPTLPAVTSTSPGVGGSDVHANATVSAVFTQAMQPGSINGTSFTLRAGAVAVPAAVSYSGLKATLTPTSDLAASTVYTATISSGVRNLEGEFMASPRVWTFSTGTPPTVLSHAPASSAIGVGRTSPVIVYFSRSMDPASLNGTNFTLTNGVTPVAGVVNYTDSTATFTPSNLLAASTVYTATVSAGVLSKVGIGTVAPTTWSFTTGTLPSAPSVLSSNPANLATGISRTPTILITFSGAMDPATLTSTNITLKNGLVAVPGTVSHTSTTATFAPTAILASNTLYTVGVSTGVKNATGIALGGAYTSTFTTVTSSPTGPALVNLGTAGNFVILAKSGVSTTGVTSVVGDVGLSPAAATLLTGFAIIAPPTTSASSAQVTGLLYAADYDPPTPTMLTTAVLDMQNAYTDAAGRVLPDFTELAAGNIQGLNLVPGLYKWGTGVQIPSAVTLTGGANDVWIFQVAGNLVVGNGAIVTLAGGAQAKNVFWQVAGQANLGTTANFKGIILSQTLISMNTGAIVLGRALAQTAVTLNATAITHP
jgi:hypothetical protein